MTRLTKKKPALPELDLNLQFGDDVPYLARHKTALPKAQVRKWLRHALKRSGEITVRIVGEKEARLLNKSYRQKDYATNVLTFDYTHEPVVAADLVLCAAVVAKEAKEQGKRLQDHYTHLLVHGALHAQGYDHEIDEGEALEMEAVEIFVLDTLGVACPY
jgi:probable rRNA maturation factor